MWANPPWTQLPKVIVKCCLNPCNLVLTHFKWKNQSWYQLLENVAVQTVEVPPGTEVYYTDRKKLLPSPQWQTAISLVDTTQKKVFLHELDSPLMQSLTFLDRGWGRDKLEDVVLSYPRVQPQVHKLTSFTQTELPKEVEVQTDFPELEVSPVYSPVLQGTPDLSKKFIPKDKSP